VEIPKTQYTKVDDINIAYQVFGSGPPVVSVPPLVSNLELSWEHELTRRVLEYWAQQATFITFDKRGIGVSDRSSSFSSSCNASFSRWRATSRTAFL
jgi:hypothetical protein